jgi:aspartyl-tRNA(Asn)/glutamyl-tRNA(Gln) amidotransferase subunit A
MAHAPPHYLGIAEAAELIRKKSLSPIELTEAILARIEAVEPRVRAFVTVLADQARQDAKLAEAEIQRGQYRGPLHGVPIAVKDIIYSKGVATKAGSKQMEDFIPREDATALARLRQAGAILVGKVVTHEFAYGVTSPPTNNPWNLDTVPGGSSGGSGAAVAAGEILGALGTDTGCSVRNPAALNGITGVRATQGRVPTFGVVPLSWSIDTVGPMTRSVRDAALMLNVVAGWDPRDPGSSSAPVPDFTVDLGKEVKGLTLGIPRYHFFDHLHPEVKDAIEKAITSLSGLGMQIREVTIPTATHAGNAFMGIIVPESAAYHQKWMHHAAAEYGIDVRLFVELGELMLAKDYLAAQKVRTLIREDFGRALGDVDLLLTPTVAAPAAKRHGHPIFVTVKYPDGYSEDVFWAYCRLTMPISMAGVPTVAIPCGFSQDGLPLGMQLTGRAFDEQTVFRVAYAYQQVTDWHARRPPL